MLFQYLVKSVMEYGVEIWGWEEIKDFEKIKTDYFRWVLGLDFCTPRYIVYKETENNKLKIEWGIRALKYEDRLVKQKSDRLTKQCWEEKKKETGSENKKNYIEKFLNSLGLSQFEIETLRELKKDVYHEIRERAKKY